MTDTLVIGYGAMGLTCAKAYAQKYNFPVLLLDKRAFEPSEYTLYQDCLELEEDREANMRRLRNLLANYHQVLLVSSAGGDSFFDVNDMVFNCASQLNISMITLCTIPFVFESERRTRALNILASMPDTARDLFLIDLQKSIREDCDAMQFLEETTQFICDSMNTLVGLLEHSPFFSLCTDPLYTIAIGKGVTYSDSVVDALAHPYFKLDSFKGKVLICSDMKPSEFEVDQTNSIISSRFGTYPEMVGYSGLKDDRVLLFIPTFCQS